MIQPLKLSSPNKPNGIWCLAVLLGCALLAYYPLTFHLFSLKNDALNYFLPVRYLISDAIQNRQLPFWTPYLNLGYPLHGDMQSGVWNPFVQFFSLFGTYTLKTLQYETLLYIFLSGMGMFFLARHFTGNNRTALWAGTAFMLCGFNSDSAQFLNWISAASFLPFVFLFYHRLITERTWKVALTFSFFFYLLFVTAYPADFIITAYLLLFYSLIWLWKNRGFISKAVTKQLVTLHVLSFLCFIALSLPAICSIYEFLKYSERGSGASFEQAMSNPYHPLLFFTYFIPLGFWKSIQVAVTDPLERNSYIGLITIAFTIGGLFIRSKDQNVRFWKWAFLATALFSLGQAGGLRTLTYYVLPLMNSFRHPANARLFTMFFGVLIAAYAFENVQLNKSTRKTAFVLLITLFVAGTIYSLIVSPVTLGSGASSASLQNPGIIKSLLDRLTFADLSLIDCCIQIPFLIILYFLFVKRFSPKWLVLAGIINCLIHTMLYQPFTVVKKDSVASIQQVIDLVKKPGYPIPSLTSSLEENSNDGETWFKEIGASNLYSKKIGRIDYRITPSNLNTQNLFWEDTVLRNCVMQYPVLYKADTAIKISSIQQSDTLGNKRIAFLQVPTEIIRRNDQAPYSGQIHINSFSPNRFYFNIDNNSPAFYVLAQNWYPRWKLMIDEKPATIVIANRTFMGFGVKAGKHHVTFMYQSNDLVVMWWISLSVTIIIIFLLTGLIKGLNIVERRTKI